MFKMIQNCIIFVVEDCRVGSARVLHGISVRNLLMFGLVPVIIVFDLP